VNATDSCAIIKMVDPGAQDGVYTSRGAMVFCDMATGTTYEEVGWGQFDVAPPAGYALIHAADLQPTAAQNAFIALYNLQGGAKTIAPWQSNNCCVTVAPLTRLKYDGNAILTGNGKCNVPGGYVDPVYQLSIAPTPPVPANFFSAHAVSEGTGCGDGKNPGLFFKTRL
jgi:hypothetical protein